MIRPDYQVYLGTLKRLINDFEIGYSNFSEEELGAQFCLNTGWLIELECEKFGSSVTVIIRHPEVGRKGGYALWILMTAFESLKGKSYGNPTIENQIRFLAEEQESLFQYPDFYEGEYAKINDRI